MFRALAAILTAFLMSITLSLAESDLYKIKLQTLDGKDTTLEPYKGKVLLIVNTASQCGLTPQYKALQSLYDKYKDQGLVVLGMPCNQFGAQEPGTASEIQTFCTKNYGVTFPLFSKLDVNGANRHPLYVFLAGDKSPFPGDIKWNFGKFLVSRDGKILARFEPQTAPDSKEVTEAVQKAL